ncbi:unnamed protein product, partial [Scytosiphon promiscuus]
GTTGFYVIRGVAIGISGSVFLTGTTDGNWSDANVGGLDFIACKLDASGNELWRWQVSLFVVQDKYTVSCKTVGNVPQ